jgi:hypothetical protein
LGKWAVMGFDRAEFFLRLKAFLREEGADISGLAVFLSLSRRTVERWGSATAPRNPAFLDVIALAERYPRCSLDWLLLGRGDRQEADARGLVACWEALPEPVRQAVAIFLERLAQECAQRGGGDSDVPPPPPRQGVTPPAPADRPSPQLVKEVGSGLHAAVQQREARRSGRPRPRKTSGRASGDDAPPPKGA